MTRLSCHRFRSNEVRLWLSVIAYNLGNLRRLVLPNRIAKLVADELAATIGEDRWAPRQARKILLALVGRRALDQAAVRQHPTADRGTAGASGVKSLAA